MTIKFFLKEIDMANYFAPNQVKALNKFSLCVGGYSLPMDKVFIFLYKESLRNIDYLCEVIEHEYIHKAIGTAIDRSPSLGEERVVKAMQERDLLDWQVAEILRAEKIQIKR